MALLLSPSSQRHLWGAASIFAPCFVTFGGDSTQALICRGSSAIACPQPEAFPKTLHVVLAVHPTLRGSVDSRQL